MKLLPLLLVTLFVSCTQKKEESKIENQSPLDKLKTGNENFVSGHAMHPDESLNRIKELKSGQKPFAVVVSCSDSRIPPELVFDQGLGDIFSIRTAGNVIGDYELGSIEYAVEHLGCRLIVVMGHENCGAIEAYASRKEGEPGRDHIESLVSYIAAEDEEKNVPQNQRSNLEALVKANILHDINLLRNSTPVLKPLYDKGELKITAAFYDLDNGKVVFKN